MEQINKATDEALTTTDGNRRGQLIDELIRTAVLAAEEGIRAACRGAINRIAAAKGVYHASIQGLYEAMARGDVRGLTVPAINIRGLTYEVARAIFRAAAHLEAGPVIFEIARTEIGYTFQSPAEYATCVTAAAVREQYQGPLFIQGDHFQINRKNYFASPGAELSAVKKLITEAIEAGFYNIDIDTSTLVDLDKETLAEQQRLNYELVAEFTGFIRALEPAGITISVGGEIGEIGGKNSDVHELEAFVTGLQACLPKDIKSISKISVQSGATHGGVVLPDGTVADVTIDFETLRELSAHARRFGMAGAVQHGASTLPEEAFHHFPATGTAEIHLATQFQNIIMDHPLFPAELREKIYSYLRSEFAGEKKPGQTDQQFIYSLRKKGWGPFKNEFDAIPEEALSRIMEDLEKTFRFLFRKLEVLNTRNLIRKYVPRVS
ncbi:class II fructose-bisphosphate aldolase [bacterium]|nr:class II fructose-bisphosphate aldolase [candidate division CSSED10-310 bacterium]